MCFLHKYSSLKVFWVHCTHCKDGAAENWFRKWPWSCNLQAQAGRIKIKKKKKIKIKKKKKKHNYFTTSATSELLSNVCFISAYSSGAYFTSFLVTFLRREGESAEIFFSVTMFLQCFTLYFTNCSLKHIMKLVHQ